MKTKLFIFSLICLCATALCSCEKGEQGKDPVINPEDVIESGTCGKDLTWTIVENKNTHTYELFILGTGDMYDYEYSYGRSTAPWMDKWQLILTKIVVGDRVTYIGNDAFDGCTYVASVTIGNSVTSIGDYAFYGCSSLTFVTIPNSVISIGGSAFRKCIRLTSVTIGNSVVTIGEGAFNGCSSMTSVTIPNSVKSIGNWGFDSCKSLCSVYITDIAAWCNISFYNYNSSPLSYAHNLYLNNNLVTNLVIPNNVTSIGKYAFDGCTSITSVEIPNSVTSIGDDAFYGCTSLTSVTNYAALPQVISEYTFKNVDISTCTLYVLEESVTAYKAANIWKDFGTILPINE